MKALRLLLATILFSASIHGAFAAADSVTVTVTDAAGKVAYRAQTNSDGAFATGALPAGNYVVQFNAPDMRGDHAIVISAGKKKVSAPAVAATQFRGGGVAMRIEVEQELKISGQVARAATGMVGANDRTRDAAADSMRRLQDMSGQGAAKAGPPQPGAGGR